LADKRLRRGTVSLPVEGPDKAVERAAKAAMATVYFVMDYAKLIMGETM
tara:strand:+ start:303 stop:449 length:147 start_codon:yes stop_codon:yes gene_type:complete